MQHNLLVTLDTDFHYLLYLFHLGKLTWLGFKRTFIMLRRFSYVRNVMSDVSGGVEAHQKIYYGQQKAVFHRMLRIPQIRICASVCVSTNIFSHFSYQRTAFLSMPCLSNILILLMLSDTDQKYSRFFLTTYVTH